MPTSAASLPTQKAGGESGEDHSWHRKGSVRLEARGENPCKSKDKSWERWGSGSEWHRGHAVGAG